MPTSGSLVRGRAFFFSGWIDTSLRMTNLKRTVLRLTLELEWQKAKRGYEAAGKPFGDGRGIDLWVEYRQWTTVN